MPLSRCHRGPGTLALGWLGLALLAWVAACGEDELTPPDDCFGGDRTICDINDLTCQERIFDVVLCLRQVTSRMEPPTVVTMTPQQYAERITPEAESIENENRLGRALSLVGLFPPDVELSSESVLYATDWIGGFYSAEDETVTLVSQGFSPLSPDAMALLAHEFVHAQQDTEHDLATYSEQPVRGVDGVLARRAVVEGEAVLYQIRFLTLRAGFELDNTEWEAYLGQTAGSLIDRVAASDFPYFRATSDFPYVFGLRLVYLAWRAGGPEAIDALFADPPRSTYTVLDTDANEPNASDEEREWVEVVIPLPDGNEVTWSTHFGAWMLGAFLVANDSDLRSLLTADWKNDAFFTLWDTQRGQAALVWVIWFQSPLGASTAATEIERLMVGGYTVVHRGSDRVALVAADSADLLTEIDAVAIELLDALDAAEAADQTPVVALGTAE